MLFCSISYVYLSWLFTCNMPTLRFLSLCGCVFISCRAFTKPSQTTYCTTTVGGGQKHACALETPGFWLSSYWNPVLDSSHARGGVPERGQWGRSVLDVVRVWRPRLPANPGRNESWDDSKTSWLGRLFSCLLFLVSISSYCVPKWCTFRMFLSRIFTYQLSYDFFSLSFSFIYFSHFPAVFVV